MAGEIDVQGEIDVAGRSLTTLPLNTQQAGQLGAAGGRLGGAGGQGGNKCLGTGYLPIYDGRHGEDGRLLAGHAYREQRCWHRRSRLECVPDGRPQREPHLPVPDRRRLSHLGGRGWWWRWLRSSLARSVAW